MFAVVASLASRTWHFLVEKLPQLEKVGDFVGERVGIAQQTLANIFGRLGLHTLADFVSGSGESYTGGDGRKQSFKSGYETF